MLGEYPSHITARASFFPVPRQWKLFCFNLQGLGTSLFFQDAFQLYEDFFNGNLFQGLLGDRNHHVFFFLLCTMVNHHQTTIWENICCFFQASYANPR